MLGGTLGSWRFTIATPAGGIRLLHWPIAARARRDAQRFRSRPDLMPPAVTVDTGSVRIAPGGIFLAPQFGPVQAGPMILDPDGNLVWFDPLQADDSASYLRVQTFRVSRC